MKSKGRQNTKVRKPACMHNICLLCVNSNSYHYAINYFAFAELSCQYWSRVLNYLSTQQGVSEPGVDADLLPCRHGLLPILQRQPSHQQTQQKQQHRRNTYGSVSFHCFNFQKEKLTDRSFRKRDRRPFYLLQEYNSTSLVCSAAGTGLSSDVNASRRPLRVGRALLVSRNVESVWVEPNAFDVTVTLGSLN